MEEEKVAKDRRFFQRIRLSLPLIFFKQKSQNAFSGQISDISANGMGLTSGRKISCKTVLNLIIRIPNDGPFCAEGEVTWVKRVNLNKYRIGILLKNVDLVGVSRILTIAKKVPQAEPQETAQPKPSFFPWFKKPGLAIP